MHSVLARYTNSEGSTIVRSVTGLDGVKAWRRRHANYNRRTLEIIFRVQIPALWRMSALLAICPKDVKEQMTMRLDEIDENYEDLKAKVVSYPNNKTEQARVGQKEMHVPKEVDHVWWQRTRAG